MGTFLKRWLSRVKDPLGFNVAKLSYPEVSSFLSSNEHSYVGKEPSAVKSYVTNQLAANNPMEDTRAEAKFLFKNGMMFGVFDGHGGASCARVLAKRLFNYIAGALLSAEHQSNFIAENEFKIVEPINDLFEWRENRVDVYNRSLKEWVKSLEEPLDVPEAMKMAFERLDSDIGKAAEIEGNAGLSLGVAMSGAVACAAVVTGTDLHVASAGDCQAVLGQQMTTNGPWKAKKLTVEHTCDNENEVSRIKNEHPPSERLTLIQDGRLFQSLVPLRSFGDYRYKWSTELLEKIAVPKYGRSVIPNSYLTPPYLTAKPDVVSIKLTEKDKFLVIGSDGLWDILSPQMVVQLVGDHMTGKSSMLQLQLNKFKDLFPGKDSKNGQELRPVDKSAATHLIRAALGGDDKVVAKQLSFPMEHVRIIRDDMTVTVVYFDTDFVSTYPHFKDLTKNEAEKFEKKKSEDFTVDFTTNERIEIKKIREKWDAIETQDKVDFDLDSAIEQGGVTNKRKLKTKRKRKSKLTKSIDIQEAGNLKKLQILSLKNQHLNPNYNEVREYNGIKDASKVKVICDFGNVKCTKND